MDPSASLKLGIGNLRREKEFSRSMGVDSEVRLRHGLVISEVFKEIRRADYDLVVTGSSPVGGTLRTYIMGNITREIVNRAECPVLVVRGGDQPAGLGSSLKGFFTHGFGSSKGESRGNRVVVNPGLETKMTDKQFYSRVLLLQ